MSSSNFPVEDGSEEREDFKLPFKASAFKGMAAPQPTWTYGYLDRNPLSNELFRTGNAPREVFTHSTNQWQVTQTSIGVSKGISLGEPKTLRPDIRRCSNHARRALLGPLFDKVGNRPQSIFVYAVIGIFRHQPANSDVSQDRQLEHSARELEQDRWKR